MTSPNTERRNAASARNALTLLPRKPSTKSRRRLRPKNPALPGPKKLRRPKSRKKTSNPVGSGLLCPFQRVGAFTDRENKPGRFAISIGLKFDLEVGCLGEEFHRRFREHHKPYA